MTKTELIALPLGEYNLTDQIDNYHYRMTVGLYENGDNYYRIKVTDYPDNTKLYINRTTNEDGLEIMYVGVGVGGLWVHSDEVHDLISQLKLI